MMAVKEQVNSQPLDRMSRMELVDAEFIRLHSGSDKSTPISAREAGFDSGSFTGAVVEQDVDNVSTIGVNIDFDCALAFVFHKTAIIEISNHLSLSFR